MEVGCGFAYNIGLYNVMIVNIKEVKWGKCSGSLCMI
jgi:hypothetical protein